MRLGIQLYTLRELDEPMTETVERLADTPFEGVQFARLHRNTARQLLPVLEETGLATAGAHVGLDTLENDFASIRETYGPLDCTEMVVPSYENEAFETKDGAREAGNRLTKLHERITADGFDLHYHNHTFEFTELGDETAFDAFADSTSACLEIDTGLASHAGLDPVSLIERYADRLSLLHLTDSQPGSDETLHVDLGEGTVDLASCVDAAQSAEVDWIIFEHGQTDDPLASMEHAAETIPTYL